MCSSLHVGAQACRACLLMRPLWTCWWPCIPRQPQVNLKLFAPEPNRRKTVLLFVIRDKSKTPLSKVCGASSAN